MVKYASKYSGLRIVIEPDKFLYLPTGEKKFKAGKSVKFVSGLFQTEDKQIIKFMDDYCKKNKETFIVQDPKDIEAEMKANKAKLAKELKEAEAKAKLEAEAKAKSENK